jgi:hypothetical protein
VADDAPDIHRRCIPCFESAPGVPNEVEDVVVFTGAQDRNGEGAGDRGAGGNVDSANRRRIEQRKAGTSQL